MKIYCDCCARQIVKNQWSLKLTAPLIGTKSLGPGKHACGDCSKDLDQHGLFPEELQFLTLKERTALYE